MLIGAQDIVPIAVLNQTIKHDLIEDQKQLFDPLDSICEICLQSKQRACSCNHKLIKTNQTGQIIHVDTYSPGIKTWDNKETAFVFVDEGSRLVNVQIVKDKSASIEAFNKLLTFQREAINTVPLKFHSDNGTEFTNHRLEQHLDQKSIKHSFSTPYIKPENGLAESSMRHLLNTTRSLLISSNLPRTLWGEAMVTAADLINIRFKRTINTSPYFAYYNKLPTIKHLKVWGTPAYTLIPKEKRSSHLKSLGPKSRKRYLVGYTESTKIFKLYDKQTRKVDRYADVVFLEESISIKQSESNCEMSTNTNPTNLDATHQQLENQNAQQSATEQQQNCNQLEHLNLNEQQSTNINLNSINITQQSNVNSDSTYDSTQIINSNNQPTKRTYNKKQYEKVDRNLRRRPIISALLAIPQSFDQIRNEPLWLQAAREEMAAHQHNKTWTLVQRPPNTPIVQCRWVFATKRSMDNQLIYKARLVAKGYTQKYGIDFFETYAPTMFIVSFRILLCIILKHNLFVRQFDVRTAFLNAKLSEKIYMCQAPGFEDGTERVYLLNRALYGLKQAALLWYNEVHSYLVDFGFERLESESCIFKLVKDGELCLIGLFIDDGIITSTKNDLIDEIIDHLNNKYEMKVGNLERFIGMQIKITDSQIIIHQQDYIDKLLNHYQMSNCNGVKTPLPTGNPVKFNDECNPSIEPESTLI